MSYFFDTTETIPEGMGFSSFDPTHLIWLGAFLATAFLCSLLYRRLPANDRRRMRFIFAALLIADELFKVVCLAAHGNYTPRYLPLHLCSINIILIAVHAVKPSRLLDNFLYVVCIPAAVAALLFPTWTSLPVANFMHIHSFTVHILLAVYPIMLTAGGDIQPQLRFIPRCLAFLACLSIPIYCLNHLLDTNFMFLISAPSGNPLYWFDQTFGNHLIGYPFLIAAAVFIMYFPLYLIRIFRRETTLTAR